AGTTRGGGGHRQAVREPAGINRADAAGTKESAGTIRVKWTADQWSCLVEALAFPAFVAWYIWKLQAAAPGTGWVLAVWLVGSYFARRYTPKTIGWRADNLWPATVEAVKFFALSFVATFVVGLFLGMLHRPATHVLVPRRFTSYLAFCVLQQVGLNSLVMN